MPHTFFYISLPFLHDCDLKMPNFAFLGEVNVTSNDEILFLFWNLDMSIGIQLQLGSPTFDN